MRRVFKLLVISVWLAVLPVVAPVAKADVNNFTIDNFQANYELSRADAQGQLKITEIIDVDYSDFNHGILRSIPDSYKGQSVRPTILSVMRDGQTEPYTLLTQSHNLVVKIGSPSRTMTGQHRYVLAYTVQNVITFYQDHDELYWDINGDQWSQPFLKVTATFNLPSDLALPTGPEPKCFTGVYGSTAADCTIMRQAASGTNVGVRVIASATRQLNANENLSVVMALPKGYFQPITGRQKVIAFIVTNFMTMIYAAAIGLAVLKVYGVWRRFGKDYKKSRIVAPAFEAPKNMSVLMAGYIYSQHTDTKHLSAQLIDLAVRGYIRIIESERKSVLKKTTNYQFELLKSDISGLAKEEQDLLTELFGQLTAGSTVNINDKKNKLYSFVNSLNKQLQSGSVAAGYYENQKTADGPRYIGYVLVVIGLLIAGHFRIALTVNDYDIGLKLWALPVAYLGLALTVMMLVTMRRRSHLGVEIVQQLDGLKLYLSTAEKDRYAMLQSANAPLAANAAEPVRDVKLFEKLLPYAILFGVEKTWSAAFKNMYTEPPEWYSGNWTMFNAMVLTEHLNSTMKSVNTAFTPPSSSNSSGFGGGGFSGGGGGGGGGGGW